MAVLAKMAQCPYCGGRLPKAPTREHPCPSCKQVFYVKKGTDGALYTVTKDELASEVPAGGPGPAALPKQDLEAVEGLPLPELAEMKPAPAQPPAAGACPACGLVLGAMMAYCPRCGTKQGQEVRPTAPACPRCKLTVTAEMVYCPRCGTKLAS